MGRGLQRIVSRYQHKPRADSKMLNCVRESRSGRSPSVH